MGSRGRWLQECLGLLGEHPCSSVSSILDDENLPLTYGVNWNELGRKYRCFRQQGD